MHVHISLGTVGVGYGDPAGFLPAVLKRRQSVIDRSGVILSAGIQDTEYAAFFLYSHVYKFSFPD